MPSWSEEARRTFYTRRYGEEEGAAKFQEWMDRQERDIPIPPQGGHVDDAPVTPAPRAQRATRATAKGRGRKGREELSPEQAKGVFELAVAGIDQAVAQFVAPQTWGQVPRLTGADEVIQRALREVFGGADTTEVERLALAMADVPELRVWAALLYKTGKKGGPWAKLAVVATSIILPRLFVLRPDLNPFAGGSSDAATGMEGGGAHGGDRDDGFGQEHPPGEPGGAHTQAVSGAQVEGGFGEVSGGTNGHVGEADPTGWAEQVGAAPPVRETAS